MQLPRRFLPPMRDLRAFEACARLGSFTAAAAELNLTQSAVSRQIRSLEDLLGVALFLRERQTVRLTPAGQSYAHDVREALQRIAGASLSISANPQGGVLNLAILPTFGTRWLAPRLPDFISRHPGITLNLVTRLAPFDFRLDAVDAAIHYGRADWPGAELDFLLPETVVPACSPALRRQHGITQPQDLLGAPLLHLASRPDAWERWFRTHGIPAGNVPGMQLDQFAVMTQAAIAGLGVALLPEFLFQGELARGDLVPALDAPMQSVEGYYLACPSHRAGFGPLQAFRAWLLAETAPWREAEIPSPSLD